MATNSYFGNKVLYNTRVENKRYYLRNAVYSATDILYAQHSLTGCRQLVRSRDLGLVSIWRPILQR